MDLEGFNIISWNRYIPERKEALIMPIAWAVRRGAGRSAIL